MKNRSDFHEDFRRRVSLLQLIIGNNGFAHAQLCRQLRLGQPRLPPQLFELLSKFYYINTSFHL